MGPDGHVVHYWVARGSFMNVVCVTEHGHWTAESRGPQQGKVADALGALRELAPARCAA